MKIMPSSNFVRHMLLLHKLPISLEEKVLRDLRLTKEVLPHKDYNKVYDKVCNWIKENRTKCQLTKKIPQEEHKKRVPPEAVETTEYTPHLRSLRSKYKRPEKIRASEETLATLVATFKSTNSIRQAAEATGLSRISARKYLRDLELDLLVVERGRSVNPEKVQELIEAFVKYGNVSCAWIEVGGMSYEYACRKVKAAGYEIKRGRPPIKR